MKGSSVDFDTVEGKCFPAIPFQSSQHRKADCVDMSWPPQRHWFGLICSCNRNPHVVSPHACYCECSCHCLHPLHVAVNEPLLHLGCLDTVK